MQNICDVVIIGGGASGLMAASHLAQRGYKVTLLEKMEKCGRKIRITGKGRCNITNAKEPAELIEKVRSDKEFIKEALYNFTSQDVISFFETNGVKLEVERGGRVFPKTGDAWDIAAALERAAIKAGATIICGAKVVYIDVDESNVEACGIKYVSGGEVCHISSNGVVVATGGCSYPTTGSDGDGYNFAYELGHEIIPVRPSLVPLEVKSPFLKTLSKTLLKNVSLSLEIDGQVTSSEFGEMEFTEFGVMGAIVLRLSRNAVDALTDNKKVALIIDLKPALSLTKLLGRIERELSEENLLTLDSLLRKLLPKSLLIPVKHELNMTGKEQIRSMNLTVREKIINTIKSFRLEVTGYRGFKEAIVTAGGVSTTEINRSNFESTKVSHLYFIGEVLDIDADTGGYNLQLAFSTAYQMANNFQTNKRCTEGLLQDK